jgi:parallel beta-helix repeat protein
MAMRPFLTKCVLFGIVCGCLLALTVAPAAAEGRMPLVRDDEYVMRSYDDLPVSALPAPPRVHNIDTGEHFYSIQEAISAPNTTAWHTIIVDSGVYSENVYVDKAVTLFGYDTGTGWPIVDAMQGGDAFWIATDGVTICIFEVTNSSRSGIYIDSDRAAISHIKSYNNAFGLWFQDSDYDTVEDLLATGNGEGIYLYNSSHNTFDDIQAVENDYTVGIDTYGDGIWFYGYTNNTFTNINASANYGYDELFAGIWLNAADGNYFENITASNNHNGYGINSETYGGDTYTSVDTMGNTYDGFKLRFSYDTVIQDVESSYNGANGLGLQYSDNVSIAEITAAENANDGVYCYDVNNTNVDQLFSHDNLADGLRCDFCSLTDIGNAQATSNAESGISLLLSDTCSLSDSVSSFNQRGVHITDTTHILLHNVTAHDNSMTGIIADPVTFCTLVNSTSYHNHLGGIDIEGDTNYLTQTSAIANFGDGIRLAGGNGSSMYSLFSVGNGQNGFIFEETDDNLINKLFAAENGFNGINLSHGNDGNLIYNSRIVDNVMPGIFVNNSSGNRIYNNYFNNTVNAAFGPYILENQWNLTNTTLKNIVGGPYLGGNFWSTPAGDGFSELNADTDGNGFCDDPLAEYIIECGNNTDYLPLAEPVPDFMADPFYGIAPLTARFYDLSPYDPIDWAWDFGDGATLVGVQNPVHTYTMPGMYDVTLWVDYGPADYEVTRLNYIVAALPPNPGGGGYAGDVSGDVVTPEPTQLPEEVPPATPTPSPTPTPAPTVTEAATTPTGAAPTTLPANEATTTESPLLYAPLLAIGALLLLRRRR